MFSNLLYKGRHAKKEVNPLGKKIFNMHIVGSTDKLHHVDPGFSRVEVFGRTISPTGRRLEDNIDPQLEVKADFSFPIK